MRTRLGRGFLALGVACAAACGNSAARPQPPAAGSGSSAAAPAADALTERECDEVIAHAIALRISELAQTVPPEQLPTEADQAAMRAELRGTFLAACRNGTRAGYACAIAASSSREFAACPGPPAPQRGSG